MSSSETQAATDGNTDGDAQGVATSSKAPPRIGPPQRAYWHMLSDVLCVYDQFPGAKRAGPVGGQEEKADTTVSAIAARVKRNPDANPKAAPPIVSGRVPRTVRPTEKAAAAAAAVKKKGGSDVGRATAKPKGSKRH